MIFSFPLSAHARFRQLHDARCLWRVCWWPTRHPRSPFHDCFTLRQAEDKFKRILNVEEMLFRYRSCSYSLSLNLHFLWRFVAFGPTVKTVPGHIKAFLTLSFVRPPFSRWKGKPREWVNESSQRARNRTDKNRALQFACHCQVFCRGEWRRKRDAGELDARFFGAKPTHGAPRAQCTARPRHGANGKKNTPPKLLNMRQREFHLKYNICLVLFQKVSVSRWKRTQS